MIARVMLVIVLLLSVTAAQAVPVTLVSRPTEEAMQAQSPTWAPAGSERPTLSYEVNDRSHRIYLRVAHQAEPGWTVDDVPLVAAGTPASFMLSERWVDRSVTWVDPKGFFFTRTLDSQPHLYYFDVAPHRVPWEAGAVEDPASSPGGRFLATAVTDASGTELVLMEVGDWSSTRPLTQSPSVAEHSPCWFDDQHLVWVATDRDKTQLWTGTLEASAITERRVLYDSPDEILVVSCCPHQALGMVAANLHRADGGHALVVIDGAGRVTHTVEDIYVEPGRPSRPAWSPAGRYVVYVQDDEAAGNLLLALDVATGRRIEVPLDVRGILDVSVGAWHGQDGPRTLLAVVAVGGADTIRNHVYVADITTLLEEGS